MADLNNVDEFASDENYLEIDNLTDFSVSGSEEYVPTESSGTRDQVRIRETRVAKSNPGVLFYKYTHNPQVGYYEIDFRKKKNGPPPEFNKCQLCLLYPHGHCVSQAKLKDIHHLLKYVPPFHHPFYLQLKSAQEDTDENDIDGLPQVLDFTPEEED